MILLEQNRYNSPDKDLNGEPGVANALNVEEGVVSIGAVLVQRPVRHISSARADGGIPGEEESLRLEHLPSPDHRDSHVGVGLQAEREDRDADEENGDHPNHLELKHQNISIEDDLSKSFGLFVDG